MKKYTQYATHKNDFERIGWSGSSRKKVDDIDAQIKKLDEANELNRKYGLNEIVYKFVDNETNEVVRTNA